ncbi:MAG: hypothetical protein WC917_00425 [Bacilli bacterium]|jgi:hypothetical protein
MARPKKQQENPTEEIVGQTDNIKSNGYSDGYGESEIPRGTSIEQPEHSNTQQTSLLQHDTRDQQVGETPVDSYDAPQQVFDDDEVRAMKSGWTPKETFKGDPDKWRDAKKWNERNNVNSLIEDQKREIAEMRRQQQELVNFMREDRERNAKIQLASLEKEKEEAIRLADVDKVKKLDEVIFSIKGFVTPTNNHNTVNQQKPEEKQRQFPQEVIDFKQRNPWFEGSDALSMRKTLQAQALEVYLDRTNPNMSVGDKMVYIEKEINQMFGTPVKNIAPVETRRSPMIANKNPNSLPDYNSLPVEVRRVVESFLEKAEFKAKKDKKAFNKGQFRSNYVRTLISDKVIDNSGNYI